ncbi:MAG: tetratricopeptide repeat protein [Bacteriovoracaceae bacterium]
MEKYRIRLANGRVVGPFNQVQITELYAKGHIDGTEECQSFPAGEWLKVLDFDGLATIFGQKLETQTFDNSTVIRKLSEISADGKKHDTSENSYTSSDFEEEISDEFSLDLKEKKNLNTEDPNFPKEFSYKNLVDKEQSQVKIQLPKVLSEQKPQQVKVVIDDEPKTVVKKSPIKTEDNADKTVVNVSTKDFLAKLKVDKAKEEIESKKLEEARLRKLDQELAEREEPVDPDMATQMFNLSQVKENLIQEVSLTDQEMDLEKRAHELKKIREKKSDEAALDKEKNKDKKTKEDNKDTKAKKGMKPIIALVFLGILAYMFFPDEEDNKKPTYVIETFTPTLDFPVPLKQEAPEESKAEYDKASALYAKGDVFSIYKAAAAYKNSLELKFNGNDALTRLILTYAELLEDSPKDREAGTEIFKLIQIAKTKAMNDIYMTMGTAIFYNHFKKYPAGINVIEDYILVNKQKSLKLISIYIDLLTNSGNVSKAKSLIDKLPKEQEKTADLYASIANYYLTNNEHQTAFKWVEEGLAKFPNNMKLIIMKADIIVYNEDFKTLAVLVKKIKSLEAEHSRRYYARYLEYYGLLAAVAKKNDEAVTFFKEALKIKESPELISKLASLGNGGGDKVVELISTSKGMDYMNKAHESMRRKKWDQAMNYAIEATDIAPKFFPAKLLLAEIQVRQGFFNNAIDTLVKLQQEFPNESSISFSLANSYTQAFKFRDALKLLDSLAASEFKNTPEYLSAMGRYYAKQNDYFQAVTWLQKSINVNPLADEDYFILASTYLKNRTYQKAKVILTKAMEIDPSSVEYKVAYSKIIYEMDDAETAIGFLREALKHAPDDPTLMSEIAIYYYRSGQQKYFEEYKKQLEELPEKNRNLYHFLMKTAELDDKPDNLVKYALELLSIEPGDLETRMQLSSVLAENGKFKEALEQLGFIEERLPTYPKLLFLRSKILYQMDKKDEAIKEALKELEANPQSEDGNILLGQIYVKSEDYVKAEQYYKNALKINIKSTDALIGLAWISFKRNNVDVALDLYSKVIKIDANHSYAHKQLGLVYKLMGQGSLAIESFKVYLQIEPDAKDRDNIKKLISELE